MPPPLASSHDTYPRDKESLLRALSTEEGRRDAVLPRDDDAENALTLMFKVLKVTHPFFIQSCCRNSHAILVYAQDLDASGSQSDPRARERLFRVILALSDKSQRVPPCILLSSIQEGHQMARGSFGEVQKGSWTGRAVALKFPHVPVKFNFKACLLLKRT
jgi:hypothetical protein